jgi:hypothetical protein
MYDIVMFVSVFLLVSRVICSQSLTVTDHCPLWHIEQNGVCQCGASINGAISCNGMDTITVIPGYCMTWDNVTQMQLLIVVFSHVKLLELVSIIALSLLI